MEGRAPKRLVMVVAATEHGGIGLNNDIPWFIPEDMKFFRELTSKTEVEGKENAVIMGRCTWESIPPKFRPLSKRVNVVLSRNEGYRANGAIVADSFEKALELLSGMDRVETNFVMGGGWLYNRALDSQLCDEIYLTKITAPFTTDTHIPISFPSCYHPADLSPDLAAPRPMEGGTYQFLRFTKQPQPHPEK